MIVVCCTADGRKRHKLSKKSHDVNIQSHASPAGDDSETSSQKHLGLFGVHTALRDLTFAERFC